MPELPSSSVDKPINKTPDDIADFFSLDDKPKEEPPVKHDKVDKSDKDEKEDADIDIELKEDLEEDEKLDLDEEGKEKRAVKSSEEEIEIDAPPKKKEVLSKYPNFFKEFPFFEKMMFRDRQYSELFGSFDDAKDVAERSQVLDRFEQDLMRGNTETVLKQIKESDKKAFDKIVDSYLPTLAKVDKEAYFEVVGNIGKHMIAELVKEAKNIFGSNKEAGEALNNAALTLNQFLFGTSNYTPPKPRVEKVNEQDIELERERIDFVRERFETSRSDLQTRVDNTLKATISEYIDRSGEMSAYIKKNATRDALVLLHQSIGNDTAFRRNLDRLWESAFNDRFSRGSLDRIRSMYLGKAKGLLPSIIKKARAEALKDSVLSSRKDKDEESEEKEERAERKRGPIESGRPRQSGGKNKMEKGESVLDFLSRD